MVDNPDFTPSQVGGLFTFLARQLAKPDNTLFVNRNLFDQVTDAISQIAISLKISLFWQLKVQSMVWLYKSREIQKNVWEQCSDMCKLWIHKLTNKQKEQILTIFQFLQRNSWTRNEPPRQRTFLNQQNSSCDTVAVLSKTPKVAGNLFLNIKKTTHQLKGTIHQKWKFIIWHYIRLWTNKIQTGAMPEALRAQTVLKIEKVHFCFFLGGYFFLSLRKCCNTVSAVKFQKCVVDKEPSLDSPSVWGVSKVLK